MLVLVGLDDVPRGLVAHDDLAHDDEAKDDDDELQQPEAELVADEVFLGPAYFSFFLFFGHPDIRLYILTFISQS